MKRTQVLVLLAVAGLVAFQYRQIPIYAASDEHNAGWQTAQSQGNTTPSSDGAKAYADHCAICHGDNREGILPAFPPLVGINRQLNAQQITEIVHNGKGRMPGFPKL